jgi:hypothetical protein
MKDMNELHEVAGKKPLACPPTNGWKTQTNSGNLPPLNLFQVWKEYEGVAMHFNDLLIRLRTQALGGVAALAALAATMVRSDFAPGLRWGVLSGAFVLLILFWVAVWVLDMRYYNRLLHGAVMALLEIEGLSRNSQPLTGLALSTRIEQIVEKGIPATMNGGPGFGRTRLPIWWFYGSVSLGLLTGLGLSICGMLLR